MHLRQKDKAVSPLIGVLLVVGLTVTLFAGASNVVFDDVGLPEQTEVPENPVEINGDNVRMMAESDDGKEVIVRTDDGEMTLSETGESVSIDSEEDALVILDDGNTETVVDRYSGSDNGFTSPPSDEAPDTCEAETLAGNGSIDNPFMITIDQELPCVSEYPKEHFKLSNNIDASGTSNWHDGDGFNPLVLDGGSFDGAGHKITGLTVDRTNTNQVGLFGKITDGEITSVKLDDATIAGEKNVASIAGKTTNTTVEYVSVTDSTIQADDIAGLTIGQADNTVVDDATVMDSTVSGDEKLGGVIGESTADTTVEGVLVESIILDGVHDIGGVTGSSSGNTTDVRTRDIDIIDATSRAGGVVGNNYGLVTNIQTTGVTITGDGTAVGGMVGHNQGGEITDIRIISPRIDGTDQLRSAGGVVGINSGSVSELRVENPIVTGIDRESGGVIGFNDGPATDVVVSGATIEADRRSGGAIGRNFGIVERFAAEDVTVEANQRSGGLVGENLETISDAYVAGGTTKAEMRSGGLIGMDNGHNEIYNTYAAVDVKGKQFTGGLIGAINGPDKQVYDSYWDTEVSGQDDSQGHAEPLTTEEMQGDSVRDTMNEFNYRDTWETVISPEDDYTTLR